MIGATDYVAIATAIGIVIAAIGGVIASVLGVILTSRAKQISQNTDTNGDPRSLGTVVGDIANAVGAHPQRRASDPGLPTPPPPTDPPPGPTP